MKIHTNKFRASAVRDALIEEKAAGRIASHVSFKVLHEVGSRSHDFAMEVQLEAAQRDNGRRAGNSGSYGAMQPEYDGYAATYDEWGWLLSALYKLDPGMIVGSVKNSVYVDKFDFDNRTSYTYSPALLIPCLEEGYDPFPFITGRAANTKRGYFIGRRGADRTDSQPHYWPGKEMPRTLEDYLQFAYPLGVPAAA